MILWPIFFDYASLKASRDSMFDMYTDMTARKKIRFINSTFMDIRGQARSKFNINM